MYFFALQMKTMDDHAEGEPRRSNNNKAGDSGDVGWYENSEGLAYTTLGFDSSGDPDPSQPRGEHGNSRRVKIRQDTTEYATIQIYRCSTGGIQQSTQPSRFIVVLLEGYNRVRNHSDLSLVYWRDTTEYATIQIYRWSTGGIQQSTQPFRFSFGLLEGYDRIRNHPDLALVYCRGRSGELMQAIRKVSIDFSSKKLENRNFWDCD